MSIIFFQSRPTDLTLVLLYVSNITDWQLNHKLNIWVGGSLATAINYPHVWRTSTFVVVCMKCTKHSTKCILVHAKSSLWVSHHNFFSQSVIKCEDLIDPMIIWHEILKITKYFHSSCALFTNWIFQNQN